MNELLLDTLIDGFDERFDVSFLTENQRRRRKRELRRRGIVDCDACGIVSAVLQSPQAIEENLQDVLSLSVEVVIQIRKYSTHFHLFFALSFNSDLNGGHAPRRSRDAFFFAFLFSNALQFSVRNYAQLGAEGTLVIPLYISFSDVALFHSMDAKSFGVPLHSPTYT